MTGTTQSKSLLLAPAITEEAWLEVSAAARPRIASQPPPLPRELTEADFTRSLDWFGLASPETSSISTFSAGAVPPEQNVRMPSIAELRARLLPPIGDTRDGDETRPSRTPPPDPVATKAAHPVALPLHLILLVLLLGAAVMVGGLAVIVVAQRTQHTVTPFSSPTAAMGHLSIVSDVPGAQVSIDGQERGTTPLEVALDPGPHAVQFTRGGRQETMALSIAARAHDVYHVLLTSPDRVPVGALRVSTPIPGARITFDGEYRGLTPMTFGEVEPGFHQVAVVQGSVTERHDVNVEQDRTTEISVAFATPPAATSQSSYGWVGVACPIPVEILENDALVGSSRVARVMMPSGSHVLDFVNTEAGFRTRRTIDVVAGKTMRVPLDVPQGVLSVNATPWAELWLDGMRIGETPLGRIPLRIGHHDLVLKHPQLGERRLQVLVRADTTARASVDMWQ